MNDEKLTRARWATFVVLLLVSGFYLYIALPTHLLWLVGSAATLTAGLLTAALDFWLRRARQTSRPLDAARRQVQAALELQRKFIDARSEKEILEAVMHTSGAFLGASGASFVPYDEWGQSLPALFHGHVPETALQSYAASLTAPQTRQRCKNCQALRGGPGCALIPLEVESPASAHCFPLHSGEREVGVLNFFFERDNDIPADQHAFVTEFICATGQALENLRARDQEIAALRYLQTASAPKSDLPLLLNSLLENVEKALDVDFALLYLPGGVPGEISSAPLLLTKSRSETAHPDLPFLEGVWKSVLASGKSLALENVTMNKHELWKGLLAVPLIWQDAPPSGVLLLGSNSIPAFAQRHQVLLETLAGQAALLIQNARLMVQVEYHAVVDERTRLAREIHDGLAQTLAFLKIQSTQMQGYLARGDMERLTNMLQANYRTLSDAYLDVRQSIDDLRRAPSASLTESVRKAAADFEQNNGIKVNLAQFQLVVEYPPNVQAQLIRIVQEALSNIRKHAKAHSVTMLGRQDSRNVWLEIRDDGVGFAPEQVSDGSRYGLRGMRERAEMIGADFQITSQPGAGTVISLRLPAAIKEEV
jgi:two-component system nitrate/nitrite sensor histidine kinase NarX